MIAPEEEDTEPSWLDTENDQLHRKEVEPLLFGTGKLSLSDPDENDETNNPFREQDDRQTKSSNHHNNNNNDNNNDNNNNSKSSINSDDASETGRTVGSSKSRGSSKSARAKSNDYGSTETSSRGSFWTIPTDVTSPVISKRKSAESGPESTAIDDFPRRIDHHEHEEQQEPAFSEATPLVRGPSRGLDPPKQNCCVKIFSTVTVFALVPGDQSDADRFPDPAACSVSPQGIRAEQEVDNDNVPFFRDALFLKTYATRGFFYTFLGLVCFDLSHLEKTRQMTRDNADSKMIPSFDDSWFALVDLIAACELIALGILYFLMGIICLQGIRNRWVQEERQKWKNYREAVKAWENQHRV
eukprot:jgi/Psemu1/66072/estExt_Genemark1.C_1780045